MPNNYANREAGVLQTETARPSVTPPHPTLKEKQPFHPGTSASEVQTHTHTLTFDFFTRLITTPRSSTSTIERLAVSSSVADPVSLLDSCNHTQAVKVHPTTWEPAS